MNKPRVYLDAGTLEQFNKKVDEFRNQDGGDDLEYVFLTNADQIVPVNGKYEVWQCRELDEQMYEMFGAGYDDPTYM